MTRWKQHIIEGRKYWSLPAPEYLGPAIVIERTEETYRTLTELPHWGGSTIHVLATIDAAIDDALDIAKNTAELIQESMTWGPKVHILSRNLKKEG